LIDESNFSETPEGYLRSGFVCLLIQILYDNNTHCAMLNPLWGFSYIYNTFIFFQL